jgi:kumamolisin
MSETGGSITSEVVWSNASGGGISDVFDLPGYQSAAGAPPSVNPGGRVGRGVPDVSGDADPSTGYEIVVGGQTITVGGTSAVAPLWAGLVALINGSLATPAGFINPDLYAQPAALRDITSGTNGAYSAVVGWDACTGLGSPDGKRVQQALAGIAQGQLWHTIRHADRTWQNVFGLIEGQEQNNPGAFSAISCGGVGEEMQLVGIAG